MNEKPTDIATTADRHRRWAELSKKYKCSNSTEKFKCFEEALLEAIGLIREQGHNPKVLFELFLQLQDKKDGRKATLLDFTAASNNPPVRFSENLKKVNATAAIDALMKLGSKLDEAAEQVSEETGVATDTIKRWRKSYMSESKNKWSKEYRHKVSAMENLDEKELKKLLSLFFDISR